MSPSTTSPFGRAFPEDGLARGVDLLSQQIWCWGRDILRPEGNVLLEQGFERLIAPPEKANKKNIYALSLASGRTVILRGFGIVYIDERFGSIFVPRYELVPRFAPQEDSPLLPWSGDDLEGHVPPVAEERGQRIQMLADLIDWVIAYERDLIAVAGIDYRSQSLQRWDNGKRRVFPAPSMVPEWQALQRRVEDLMLTAWSSPSTES